MEDVERRQCDVSRRGVFNVGGALAQRDTAFREAAEACVQVASNAAAVPACAQCLRPLEDLALHVKHQTRGAVPSAEALVRAAAWWSHEKAGDPEVGCTWCCGARFCCVACRDAACSDWHAYLCPARAAESGSDDVAHPLREFANHAAAVNDLFLLAGRLLCSALAAAVAADDVCAAAALQAARLAAAYPGRGQPLWDVVAEAARPDDTSARRRLRVALKEQVLESYTLLEAGLLHAHRHLRGGDDDTPVAALLSADVYARLLGALHLCVQPVTAPSPLTRLCERLPHLSRDALTPALAALQPVIRAVTGRTQRRNTRAVAPPPPPPPPSEFKVSSLWASDGDPVPPVHAEACAPPVRRDSMADAHDIDWADAPERIASKLADTAHTLFDGVSGLAVAPTCACVGHSCVPNVQIEAQFSTDGLRLAAVALRDIAADEELCIAYVATSSPVHARAAALKAAGHTFVCACPKCILGDAPGGDATASQLPDVALHALAKQAQEEGKYDDATALLNAIIVGNNSGGDPDAHHALGVCLLAQGDWVGAHTTWAAAARRWPDHATLRAQSRKDAAYWPAEHAPRVGSSGNAVDGVVPHPDGSCGVRCIVPGIAALSAAPLLSAAECAGAIEAAEAGALASGGWTTQRHYAVPTTDIPVHAVPRLLALFNGALERSIAPFVSAYFPDVVPSPHHLRIHDAFLVRYDARGAGTQQRFLPLHVDESQISLTVALNSGCGVDFHGGGTYFDTAALAPDARVVCPDAGHVLAFRGDQRHGGEPITSGVRYIIAVFAWSADAPRRTGDVK